MEKRKIREIADLSTGYPFDGNMYSSEGMRVLRGENIGNGELDFCERKDKRWNNEFPKADYYSLRENDIVMQMDGNVGKNKTKLSCFDIPMYIAQRVGCLRAKEGYSQDYLYYAICSNEFQRYVDSIKTGTSIKHISLEQIGDYTLTVYNYNTQKKIGETLSLIDSKIAHNTRINAELEAMAKQLYDYWFVQFDFPDKDGKPYKSSGGKMVYNETLKREIPESWEVKNMNQLAESFRGVTYNKEDLVSESDDSILVLRGNNIPRSGQFAYDSNVAYIPREMVSVEQRLNKGDIIITMSSGSKEHIGKCFMFQYDSKHTFGAFLSKFVPHEECRYYVYLSMLSDYFKAFVKTTCNGTGINNLTIDTFNNVFFAVPSFAILSEFEKLAESIYNKVGLSQKTIYDLTNLRDSLLPMLMNGQVIVE